LICVDIVKFQVKCYLLLDFLHIILFLTNLASTGGPHEISRRAACGPQVGQQVSGPYFAQDLFEYENFPYQNLNCATNISVSICCSLTTTVLTRC